MSGFQKIEGTKNIPTTKIGVALLLRSSSQSTRVRVPAAKTYPFFFLATTTTIIHSKRCFFVHQKSSASTARKPEEEGGGVSEDEEENGLDSCGRNTRRRIATRTTRGASNDG